MDFRNRLIIIILFMFILSISCYSQLMKGTIWYYEEYPVVDSTEYNKYFKNYEKRKQRDSSPWMIVNPIKFGMVLFIKTYQFFFSQLDGSHCQFRPSCSHFGVLAVKKYGLKGILMTADRLLRCNPFTYKTYPLTPDRKHHYDPVEKHDLKLKDLFNN